MFQHPPAGCWKNRHRRTRHDEVLQAVQGGDFRGRNMANIGSLALQITANTSGLSNALVKTASMVSSFAGKMGGMLSSIGGGGLSGLASGFAQLGMSLGKLAVDSSLAFVSKLISKFQELAPLIDRSAKQSRRLGMSLEDYTGMQHHASMAGLNTAEYEKGLSHFKRHFGGETTEAIMKFADTLENAGSTTARNQILFDTFGKSGTQWVTFFESGSKGIRESVAEAKALGISLNAVDASKVEAANDAMHKVSMANQGLWNRIVVAAAPLVEFFSGVLVDALKALQPAFQWIADAAQEFGDIISSMWSAGKEMVSGWITSIADALGITGEFFDGWKNGKGVMFETMRSIAVGFGYVVDAFKVGIGGINVVIGNVVKAVGWLVAKIGEFADMGKSLPGSVGKAFGAIAENAKSIGKSMRAGGNWIEDKGLEWLNSWGDNVASIKNWFDNEIKRREYIKPKAKPDNGSMISDYQQNPAALFGSKEAYSIMSRFTVQGMTNDPVGIAKNQLAEQKRTNQLIEQVVAKLDKGGNVVALELTEI